MKASWLAFAMALIPTLAGAQTVVLPLVTAGNTAVNFEARRSDVYTVGGGYMVTGDAALVMDRGRLALAGSRLFFDVDPQTQQIVRVRGEAFVPSPFEGSHVVIKRPAMAEFGMDTGRNIALGVPLQDDRTYFYFRFNSGFEMEIGATGQEGDPKPLKLAIPAGLWASLIVDPLDPFFFFSGGMLTPSDGGDSESNGGTETPDSDQPSDGGRDTNGQTLGLGISVQSLIPFRPTTTHGIAQHVREFTGNRILTGTFQLGAMPVEVSGVVISDVRVGSGEEAVDPLGIGIGPWAEMGVNGSFAFNYAFLKITKLGKIASFGFDLGQATAALQVIDDVQHMYFSGIIEPDTTWLPDFVPLKPEGRLKAYGYMSSSVEDFVLHTDGRYAIDASVFGQMAGVDVGDILAVEGSLHIDKHGMRIQGRTDAGLGSFGYDEQRWLDVWIPFNADPAYLTVGGLNQIATMSVRGQLHVTRGRVDITGRLETTAIDTEIQAAVTTTSHGTRLTGEMTVPSQFTADAAAAIVAESQRVSSELVALLDAYEQATANYRFELSLRGMRSLIPPFCDAILKVLNSAEATAHARIDQEWPWYLPGKSDVKREVTQQLNVHRSRFSTLKARVQTGDSESVRAAVASAINAVLANQIVTIRVFLIGTVYTRDLIDATQESRLRTALAAIAALPAASSVMVSAQTVWNLAPRREALVQTANAIAAGVAPRITRVGFDQVFGLQTLTLYVVLEHQGQASTLEVAFDPARPEQTGAAAGRLFAAGK